jgi:diacylglycerol kinase family enzyme
VISVEPPSPGAVIAILRNPWSGPGRRKRYVHSLLLALKSQGLKPRLFSSRARLTAWMANPRHRESLYCLVAAGGDGTISDLMTRFPGVRLATIPLGTENLLARQVGIPRDGAVVAHMIAAGRTWTIDACELGMRRFCLLASIGIDAAIVHRTHAGRRGNIHKYNYLGPIVATLRTYRFPRLRVWLDDDVEPQRCRLLLIANHAAYALGLQVMPEARGDDGWLDVRLFAAKNFWSTWKLVWCAWRGTLARQSRVHVVWRRATRIRVDADVPVPIQVDGDPAGSTPAEIRILPKGLRMVVPPDFSPQPAHRMLTTADELPPLE